MNRQLSSVVVREWMERASGNSINLGMRAEESLLVARRVWRELIASPGTEPTLRAGVDLPDVLHALVAGLKDLDELDPAADLPAVTALYRLVIDKPEMLVDQDEAHSLAADFAYVAWNTCRRLGRCREMREWEKKCDAQVMLQDSTRDFLSLPLVEQPERLRERFLLDGATMVAFCHRLATRRNQQPARAEADARLAFHWVVERGSISCVSEVHAYFAGQLALCAATACKHLGRFHDAEEWAILAERWFRDTLQSEMSLARLQFFALVQLYDRHLPQRVLNAIPRVMQNLRMFDLGEEYQRCRFLEAAALKSVGRVDDCLSLLIEMSQEADVRCDPMLHGSVLINMAELQAGRGDLDQALRLFDQALPVLNQAEMPWGLADRFAMMGQVLRDYGRLDEAVYSYRSAISIMDSMRMDGRAAYLRVVVAETLIALGRQREAIEEILAALPVLDREAVIPPAMAAIALLRESIRRKYPDPHALRKLREQLEQLEGKI